MANTENRLFGRRIDKKEIFYGGFAVGETSGKNLLVADTTRNCCSIGGALSRGLGLQAYTVNGLPLRLLRDERVQLFALWDSDDENKKRERIGYVDENKQAYIYDKDTGAFASIGAFPSEVTFVQAIDKDERFQTIATCDIGALRWYNGRFIIAGGPTLQAVACFCAGRVFSVSQDFQLTYSAPFEPTNWEASADNGGRITLRHDVGKIVGLAELKHRLCVLYEYGISVLDLGGSSREFVRRDMEYNGGRALKGTLCVANVQGERAFFLAEDGIYAFDGGKVEKICKNIPVRAMGEYSCQSGVKNGKYYVTFVGENGAWKTVCVDLESGLGYETFVMQGLFALNGRLLCSRQTGVYQAVEDGNLPTGEEAVFSLSHLDFSVSGNKTVAALRFTGEGTFQLRLSNGKKTVERIIRFQNGFARVPIGLRARDFSLTIKLANGGIIRTMTAELQRLT